MARHHKKHHNIGGGAWYAGGESHVAKEAKEKAGVAKRGGRAHHRKYGGRTMGKPSGALATPRLDKRARGGGIGAEYHPFSSAAKASDIKRTTTTPPSLGRPGHTHREGGNPPLPYRHGGHVHHMSHKHKKGHHADGGHTGLMHHHASGGEVQKKK